MNRAHLVGDLVWVRGWGRTPFRVVEVRRGREHAEYVLQRLWPGDVLDRNFRLLRRSDQLLPPEVAL